MNKPSALAIILARGGSKGVPRKNMREVGGRPCLAWTIDAALAAMPVGTVVVSTDDPDIAALAETMGARSIKRPAELAGDSATVDDAARHAAQQVEGSPIVILYANVPVRPSGLIDRAVELLLQTGCDSVQSYAPVGKHHPWWMARVDDAGRVAPWEGTVLNNGVFRRQDLPPAYLPDGGVLAVTRSALFLEVPGVAPGPHAFLGRDRRGILTAEGEVIDIDTTLDLAVADAILQEEDVVVDDPW